MSDQAYNVQQNNRFYETTPQERTKVAIAYVSAVIPILTIIYVAYIYVTTDKNVMSGKVLRASMGQPLFLAILIWVVGYMLTFLGAGICLGGIVSLVIYAIGLYCAYKIYTSKTLAVPLNANGLPYPINLKFTNPANVAGPSTITPGPVPGMRFCGHCGAENKSGARFCAKCGSELK